MIVVRFTDRVRASFLQARLSGGWGSGAVGAVKARPQADPKGCLDGFHASETIAAEKGGPKDRGRTAKRVGAETAERWESTSLAGQKMDRGGTSPALRAGEGEPEGGGGRSMADAMERPGSGEVDCRAAAIQGTVGSVRPGARKRGGA